MALPMQRRFDVDEYHHMAATGVLHPDERVELLDGEVVQMAAIGSRHMGTVNRLNRLFTIRLGDRALVSVQGPVRLDRYSEPEPDLAVLRPRADDYTSGHPGPVDVLFLIEVADSSVGFDRGVKLPLYAAAGVPEVWLVDLPAGVVEVSTGPSATGFGATTSFGVGEVVAPGAVPDVALVVSELLA